MSFHERGALSFGMEEITAEAAAARANAKASRCDSVFESKFYGEQAKRLSKIARDAGTGKLVTRKSRGPSVPSKKVCHSSSATAPIASAANGTSS